MSRPIVLSNSQLHVGLNEHGLVHDFYYPYVGLENHVAGRSLQHRIGVWVGSAYSWLDDGSWDISPDYYGDVLVSKIIAVNSSLGIRLEFDDCVDSEYSAFLRNIHVINLSNDTREIRLFMHQVFVISESNASDTVQYLPEDSSIIHYKGHRVFYVEGRHFDGRPFDTYTVGRFGVDGHAGTYIDAEDGQLMKNNVEHGKVDSTIGFHLQIDAHSSQRVHYWIVAGRSEREVKKTSSVIRSEGLLHHVLKTANWWAEWAKPAKKVSQKLPEQYRKGFIRSALIIRSHMDKHGAVIASTDSTMLNYERDAYGYCWPRDAAYVLWPLLRMGYTEEPLRFFAFARRSLHSDGYLSHKYQADGAVGSSWHPYVHKNGEVAPPIQTDESALVLFLFGQYYRMHAEPELLVNFYITLIKPLANFLSSFVDDRGLPLPSYDLWEEKRLTTTYTTAATYAALTEAAFLATEFGDSESAERWQSAASAMYKERDVFYSESTQSFIKGYATVDGVMQVDETVDSSSLYGAFMFGYFQVGEQQVSDSYSTLRDKLTTHGARVIRYEHDEYRRENEKPSNPWPVTSLWYAQYAHEIGDDQQARAVLDWVTHVMLPSGVLAEQYGVDEQLLSVAPLAWSHAEYMSALLDMITETES